MVDVAPENLIATKLDLVLSKLELCDEGIKHRARELRDAESEANKLEAEAQRLRMALFALNGEYDRGTGEANAANLGRRAELKQQGRDAGPS